MVNNQSDPDFLHFHPYFLFYWPSVLCFFLKPFYQCIIPGAFLECSLIFKLWLPMTLLLETLAHRLSFEQVLLLFFLVGKAFFALAACMEATPFLQVNYWLSSFLFIVHTGRLIIVLSLLHCPCFWFTDQNSSLLLSTPGRHWTPGGVLVFGVQNQEALAYETRYLGTGVTGRLIVALFCSVPPWLIVVFVFTLFFYWGCNLEAGKTRRCWDWLVQVGDCFLLPSFFLLFFKAKTFSMEGVVGSPAVSPLPTNIPIVAVMFCFSCRHLIIFLVLPPLLSHRLIVIFVLLFATLFIPLNVVFVLLVLLVFLLDSEMYLQKKFLVSPDLN